MIPQAMSVAGKITACSEGDKRARTLESCTFEAQVQKGASHFERPEEVGAAHEQLFQMATSLETRSPFHVHTLLAEAQY